MDSDNYGIFYIVATPIGNMGDITFRAIDTLKNVDEIYAEDTREFAKLKERYDINNKAYSYNAHASAKTHEKIVESLLSGKNIALISDAGTPGISDPGALIINYLIQNHPEVKISPVPGASALTSAVSVSGILGNAFTFMGFAPHKKGRETFFTKSIESDLPCVFYESTHRIENLLSWYLKNAPEKEIMLAREITKMFETIRKDTAQNHLNYIKENLKEKKGEFTIIVYNNS